MTPKYTPESVQKLEPINITLENLTLLNTQQEYIFKLRISREICKAFFGINSHLSIEMNKWSFKFDFLDIPLSTILSKHNFLNLCSRLYLFIVVLFPDKYTYIVEQILPYINQYSTYNSSTHKIYIYHQRVEIINIENTFFSNNFQYIINYNIADVYSY